MEITKSAECRFRIQDDIVLEQETACISTKHGANVMMTWRHAERLFSFSPVLCNKMDKWLKHVVSERNMFIARSHKIYC